MLTVSTAVAPLLPVTVTEHVSVSGPLGVPGISTLNVPGVVPAPSNRIEPFWHVYDAENELAPLPAWLAENGTCVLATVNVMDVGLRTTGAAVAVGDALGTGDAVAVGDVVGVVDGVVVGLVVGLVVAVPVGAVVGDVLAPGDAVAPGDEVATTVAGCASGVVFTPPLQAVIAAAHKNTIGKRRPRLA